MTKQYLNVCPLKIRRVRMRIMQAGFAVLLFSTKKGFCEAMPLPAPNRASPSEMAFLL